MPLADIILGYDCNLSCDYCTITPHMRERALDTRAVQAALIRAQRAGYDAVQFTGGEPTLRSDLMGLVKFARQLGFHRITVQSNGLMWSSMANVRRALAAGVTEFSISVHAHTPEAYERIVARPGSHELMRKGLEQLVSVGAEVLTSLIIKRDTYEALPDAVGWLAELGIRRVDLWFVSLTDANAANPESMPQMSETLGAIRAAAARAAEAEVQLRSLHIPHCLLGDLASLAWNPTAQGVRVVSPDAEFDLRDSELTPSVYVGACEECELRAKCAGMRRDYLARFGDLEVAGARNRPSEHPPRSSLPQFR